MSVKFPSDSPPGGWALRAMKHWKDHFPAYYQSLQRSGQLKEAAVEVEEAAEQAYNDYRKAGNSHELSSEMALREYILTAPTDQEPNSVQD